MEVPLEAQECRAAGGCGRLTIVRYSSAKHVGTHFCLALAEVRGIQQDKDPAARQPLPVSGSTDVTFPFSDGDQQVC